MTEKLKKALDILYGSAGYPVCACDAAFCVQWQSGPRAAVLAEQLRAEQEGRPLSDDAVRQIMLTDGADAFRCETEPLADGTERLYLLRFFPAERSKTLNRTESVLLLKEQASLIHAAGASILYAADRLNRAPDEDGLPADPAVREPFLSIQDQCYALLRQSLCDHELLWYESAAAPFPVIELTRPLRRFFGQTEILTERYLQAGCCDLDIRLFAETDENRLTFALTALLTEALRDVQGQNVLDLSARREDGMIRIVLVLRHDPAQQREPFPLPGRLRRSASPASDGLLLERFCDTFGARIRRRTEAGSLFCTLELPAADSPGAVVRAASLLQEESRFSLFHVMLSALIPAEVLWESDPTLW